MVALSDISYSRDECVAAVRDYYAFLVKMYLKESVVIEPPEGGWPSITSDSLRDLGKTEEVISLLRYLPYITTPEDAPLFKPHGSPNCFWADWQCYAQRITDGLSSPYDIKICSEGDFEEDIPPHVIGLTYGGRNNPIFLLDTRLGIVHWPECAGEIQYSNWDNGIYDDVSSFVPENEAEWREQAPAWPIAEFFEVLKNNFKELIFLPYSSRKVRDVYARYATREDQRNMEQMVQSIYREHSWPNIEQYRKEECLEAIQKAMEERYPEWAERRENE
jgi:hypothetical protein